MDPNDTGTRLLDVANLVKHYGRHRAVQDISFHASAGEIVGFLGPNGAGKTTTLKMVAGLLLPTAGDIRIAGRSVVTDAVEARRVANFEAERLLAERYRAGEITLEQFESDLADLLARRDRLEGPDR